jgi:uncharacterized membrane protein
MSILNYLFSFLCSQDPLRSFVIDGHILPFCQRCTGLYMGLGITCLFLLASRLYKKGLPPLSVIYVNIASLLIMPIFGFHFLDPGPAWRFWSGLLYGNAVASLLLPAASIIRSEGLRVAASKPKALGMASDEFTFHKLRFPFRNAFRRWLPKEYSTYSFFALFAFLNTIPLWFPIQSSFFYYVVLMLALTGLFCVLSCLIAIIVCLIKNVTISLVLKGISNGYAKNDTCHRY